MMNKRNKGGNIMKQIEPGLYDEKWNLKMT